MNIVKILLVNGADPNYLDNTLSTPMHAALGCTMNLDLLVTYLLDQGSNLMLPEEGTTPLHVACSNGQTTIVELFLSRGIPDLPNLRDHDGCTPLHVAITATSSTYRIVVVTLLLSHGANPYLTNNVSIHTHYFLYP
jgi:ankyrin repeat protein